MTANAETSWVQTMFWSFTIQRWGGGSGAGFRYVDYVRGLVLKTVVVVYGSDCKDRP